MFGAPACPLLPTQTCLTPPSSLEKHVSHIHVMYQDREKQSDLSQVTQYLGGGAGIQTSIYGSKQGVKSTVFVVRPGLPSELPHLYPRGLGHVIAPLGDFVSLSARRT